MSGITVVRAALCALAVAAASADARVTEINVVAVEPFAAGTGFRATGAYERVRGTFKGELDPNDARNKVIVNLDKAPRNARGMVEYEADFFLLRPADAARGNRKIIYDVTNRGRKFLHFRLMDAKPPSVAAANDPKTLEDAGTGLFFRRGYTLAWSGWDSEAPRAANGMAMQPIVATDSGKPIVRVIRDELVSGTRSRVDPPKPGEPPKKQTLQLSYEAASLDQSQAKLTARRGEADARLEIPASGWAYAGPRAIELLPAGAQPAPGTLY